MVKQILFWFLLLGILVLLISLPRLLTLWNASAEGEERSRISSDGVPVETVQVELEEMAENLRVVGTVLAEESVVLRPEEGGRLVMLNLPEGEIVEEGELLAQINDRIWQAELQQAEGRLALARLQAQRQERLREARSVSQEELDRAQTEVQVLEGELAEVEARLERFQLKAPFRGMVGLRQVSEGAMVDSSTTLGVLKAIDAVRVEFSIGERDIAYIQNGRAVEFRLTGHPEPFEAEIFARDVEVDRNTRTRTVRARAENTEDYRFVPGSLVQVTVPLHSPEAVILIPSVAVVPGLEENIVFVVEDGVARERSVETGRRTSDRIQILSGLDEGDRVVVLGVEGVREGTKVREGED